MKFSTPYPIIIYLKKKKKEKKRRSIYLEDLGWEKLYRHEKASKRLSSSKNSLHHHSFHNRAHPHGPLHRAQAHHLHCPQCHAKKNTLKKSEKKKIAQSVRERERERNTPGKGSETGSDWSLGLYLVRLGQTPGFGTVRVFENCE